MNAYFEDESIKNRFIYGWIEDRDDRQKFNPCFNLITKASSISTTIKLNGFEITLFLYGLSNLSEYYQKYLVPSEISKS